MADTVRISLEIATQAADIALKNLKKTTDNVDKTFSVFKGNFAAGLAVDGIKSAFNKLSGFVSTLVDEASASEQAIQNLNIALKSTGLYTPKASQDMQEFASSLQAASIYSDEAVIATQGLLLSLTSLDKDGVKAATQAAADLAATLNIDLGTATEMISKAVNGNTLGFKKIGIQIQSADNDADRLKNTLQALASQHGAAEAATNTFAGAMAKAKNQQSESFEALGKLITQHPAVIGGIKAMSEAFTASADWITKNKTLIADLVTALSITAGVVTAAAAAWGIYAFATTSAFATTVALASAIGGASAASVILTAAASAAWAAITAPITIIVAGVALVSYGIYQLVKNWDSVKAATYDALAATIEFTTKFGELFSSEKAVSSRLEAKAFREQAAAIRESAKAAKEKAEQDKANDAETGEQKAKREKRDSDARKEALAHSTFLASNKKITNDTLTTIESEGYQALLDLGVSYNQEKDLQDASFDVNRLEKFNADTEQRLLMQQELDRQELELQIAKQTASAQAELDDVKRREELQVVFDKAKIDRAKLTNKQELDIANQKIEGQKKLDAEALAAKTNTLNLFATLSNSKNKELAAIGKAAGLVQIAMATPVAVTDSFKFGAATGGPILGGIFAGIAAAAMAAQAAQLTGIQFADGGIVPGTSFTGDRVAARVNSGEMVLNATQQKTLFEMANGKGSGSGELSALADQVRTLAAGLKVLASQPLIVNVDGRQLFNITRDQLNSGRSY